MGVKHFDIIIPGHYFCDIIFTGIPRFPALGTELYTENLMVVPGGIINTVVGLRRLGVNVGWIGALGNDFFSRFIREQIEAEKLDMTLLNQPDAPLQRVTVALSYPGDRAFVTYVDPVDDVVDMLLARLDGLSFSHLHFASLQLDERLFPLIQTCREKGIRVTMDCQHRDDTLDTALVRETLQLIDIFMPNALEAQKLTQTNTVNEAADVLAALVPTLVIKDGAGGAHAWHKGAHYHAPALALTPLDTTGAGDAFNAGFLTALLAGEKLETCLRWGNICGGKSTQGYGGASTTPTRAEVESILKTGY